jgi:hypothetical protein
MAKRREPTASEPVELKLDIPEGHTEVVEPERQQPEADEQPPHYNPVPMEPGSPEAVLNNLMVRELTDPSGPMEALSPTIGTLKKLVNGLTYGNDISDIKRDITRIAQHQPEKSDVFNAIINLIDQERVADAVEMRAGTEKILKRAVKRGDLSTGEALVVHRLTNNIIQEVLARQADSNKGVDTVTIVEKVDYARQHVERSIQQKWDGTSPQGREIIRKKIFELKKEVSMALTPPTTTPV